MPKAKRQRLSCLQFAFYADSVDVGCNDEVGEQDTAGSVHLDATVHERYPENLDGYEYRDDVSPVDENADTDFLADGANDFSSDTSDTFVNGYVASQNHNPDSDCTISPNSTSGWTVADICSILEIWRVKHGVSKIALGGLLQIISIVADHLRDDSDRDISFPDTKELFFAKLKPSMGSFHPKTTYLCTKENGRGKCWGKLQPSVSTEIPQKTSMICVKCSDSVLMKDVLKSYFYWTGVSLREIILDAVDRFRRGFRWNCENQEDNTITDILNGNRVKQMNIHPDDVKIIVYADGAQISKSTQISAYFVYIQIVDFHPMVRETLMYVYAVYVHRGSGTIPSDRDFIFNELVSELKTLDRDNSDSFRPVIWTDEVGKQVHSGVKLVAIKGDSPELHALAGSEGHGAKDGCMMCHQKGIAVHRKGVHFSYRSKRKHKMRQHEELLAIHNLLRSCAENPFEYKHLYTTGQLHGIKRFCIFADVTGFDLVSGFLPDEMHTIFAGIGKRMGKLTYSYEKSVWMAIYTGKGRKKHFESVLSRMEKKRTWMRTSELFDRLPRPLKYSTGYKAHEQEFNVVHAAPYFLYGVVDDVHWRPWKELSRIVDICHKRKVTKDDLTKLDLLLQNFLTAYKKAFGEENIKFVVHMISHFRIVLENYGPTQNVSCADGESQNGKIVRGNNVSNDTTAKSMVNNYYSALSCKRSVVKKLTTYPDVESLPDVLREAMLDSVGQTAVTRDFVNRGAVCITCTSKPVLATEPEALLFGARLKKYFPSENGDAEEQIWLTSRILIKGRFHARSAKDEPCSRNETWFFCEKHGLIVKVWFIATMGREVTSISQWYCICKSWLAVDCEGHLGIEHYYKLPVGTIGETRILPVALLSSQAIVLSDASQNSPNAVPDGEVVLSRENRLFRAK